MPNLLLLAKIPIPFVVYGHPAPWIFLIVAVLGCGLGLRAFYGDGPVDPELGLPAAIFAYSGYHMVGGLFNGVDPFFYFGMFGTLGSALYGYHIIRGFREENLSLAADEPERLRRKRQEGIKNLISTLGCSQDKAEELMDRFQDDDIKAILEVRAGLSLATDKPADKPAPSPISPQPLTPRVQAPAGPDLTDPDDRYMLLQASTGPKDYAKMGKHLASVSSHNAIDAVQLLKAHRGAVICPGLSGEVADGFARLLREDGMMVLRMPMSKVLTFQFLGEAKTLEYQEQALVITNTTDETISVPWDQIILLSVALFGAQVVPDARGLVDMRKGLLCADLFVWQEERCYQIALDSKRLTYAHLGGRMEATAIANFRLTIADLAEKSPNMMKNDSVEPLIKSSMARSYRAPEDFAGESTGLLQLVQATRLRGGAI